MIHSEHYCLEKMYRAPFYPLGLIQMIHSEHYCLEKMYRAPFYPLGLIQSNICGKVLQSGNKLSAVVLYDVKVLLSKSFK